MIQLQLEFPYSRAKYWLHKKNVGQSSSSADHGTHLLPELIVALTYLPFVQLICLNC